MHLRKRFRNGKFITLLHSIDYIVFDQRLSRIIARKLPGLEGRHKFRLVQSTSSIKLRFNSVVTNSGKN